MSYGYPQPYGQPGYYPPGGTVQYATPGQVPYPAPQGNTIIYQQSPPTQTTVIYETDRSGYGRPPGPRPHHHHHRYGPPPPPPCGLFGRPPPPPPCGPPGRPYGRPHGGGGCAAQ